MMGFPRWLLQRHQPASFDAKLEAKLDYFAAVVFNFPSLKAPWSSPKTCPEHFLGPAQL